MATSSATSTTSLKFSLIRTVISATLLGRFLIPLILTLPCPSKKEGELGQAQLKFYRNIECYKDC